MHIRAIDSDGDWFFGKGLQSYKYDNSAIAQNVKSRILSFLNDCWFDMEEGIDWFRLLGSKNTQTEIELAVRKAILLSYGVIRATYININLTSVDRNLIITYNIDTIFSTNIEETVEV